MEKAKLITRFAESPHWTGSREDVCEILSDFMDVKVSFKKRSLKPSTKTIKEKEKQTDKSEQKKKMGLSGNSLSDLKKLAREYGVKGFSKLNKQPLIEAIEKHIASNPPKPTGVQAKCDIKIEPEVAPAPAPPLIPLDEEVTAPVLLTGVEDVDDSHPLDSDDELLLETEAPSALTHPSILEDSNEDYDYDYNGACQVSEAVRDTVFAEEYD